MQYFVSNSRGRIMSGTRHSVRLLMPLFLTAVIISNAVVVLCQPAEVGREFCSALEELAASAATPPTLHCTASNCSTLSCAQQVQTVPVIFTVQFSVCSAPRFLDVSLTAAGMDLLSERVGQSEVVTAPFVNVSITFDQLSNAIAFELSVQSEWLVATLFNHTTLPLSCHRNISGSLFRCSLQKDEEPARSVHQLRPSDVSVVAAMGDSISAGLRVLAKSIFDVPYEDRGVAWSGGGYSNLDYVTTLPNILKHFNPNLTGYATQSDNPVERQDQSLNVAVSGATTFDLLQQAHMLVERISSNPAISIANDWKLITIFIGYNDLCKYSCHNSSSIVNNSVDNIRAALDYLHEHLPRTFVNLVSPADITGARRYSLILPACRIIYNMNCPCAYANDSQPALNAVQKITREFHYQLNSLIDSGRYDITNDFSVVVQQFLENYYPTLDENGLVDFSLLAVDCLHLSPVGNRVYATSLWRNMLQPIGAKSTTLDLGERLNCPSQEFPYFYTRINTEGCPPLCSHDYCSQKATRRSMCRLPGLVAQGHIHCTGQCKITSCRACYYSKEERGVPGPCPECLDFPFHREKCFRKWITCVRRANFTEHGNPRKLRRK